MSKFIKNLALVTIFSVAVLVFGSVSGASTGGNSSFIAYYLQLYNSINNYRAKHTIAALKLNHTLSEVAEYFAQRILTVSDAFDIDESDGIDTFVVHGPVKPRAQFVVDTWYNESIFYDFNNPGHNVAYLNFTQMIWKGTTSVGFGTHTFNNSTSVVAKFYPAGNVRGRFRQNVIAKYKRF